MFRGDVGIGKLIRENPRFADRIAIQVKYVYNRNDYTQNMLPKLHDA